MSVKLSFYIGGFVFISAVIWTIIRTKEYSPEVLREFSTEENSVVNYDTDTDNSFETSVYVRRGFYWIFAGLMISLLIYIFSREKELYILSVGIGTFGLIQIISGLFVSAGKTKNGLVVVLNDLYRMPKTMGQLAIVQFFSWFALFSMWIYTTSAVTSHIYGTKDPTSELYSHLLAQSARPGRRRRRGRLRHGTGILQRHSDRHRQLQLFPAHRGQRRRHQPRPAHRSNRRQRHRRMARRVHRHRPPAHVSSRRPIHRHAIRHH